MKVQKLKIYIREYKEDVVNLIKNVYCHRYRTSFVTIADEKGMSVTEITKRPRINNLASFQQYIQPKVETVNAKSFKVLSLVSDTIHVYIGSKQDNSKLIQEFKKEYVN